MDRRCGCWTRSQLHCLQLIVRGARIHLSNQNCLELCHVDQVPAALMPALQVLSTWECTQVSCAIRRTSYVKFVAQHDPLQSARNSWYMVLSRRCIRVFPAQCLLRSTMLSSCMFMYAWFRASVRLSKVVHQHSCFQNYSVSALLSGYFNILHGSASTWINWR